jgi:tetratricopeptide (TPR) repeat protein
MTAGRFKPKSAQSLLSDYGILALLWLWLPLGGGKSHQAMLVWGLAALLFVFLRLRLILPRVRPSEFKWEVAVAVALLISQLNSRDPNISLIYSTEALLFLLLWISFRLAPETIPADQDFSRHLTAMGLLTLGVTLYQRIPGAPTDSFGFFPINPVFNATWLACVGVALLAMVVCGQTFAGQRIQLAVALGALGTLAFLPNRSALIAVAPGLVYAIRPLLTRRRLFFGLLIVTLTFTLLPHGALGRTTQKDPRLPIWSMSLRASLEHPLAGTGLGNFEMVYLRHAYPVPTDIVRYGRTTSFAHNEYLQVLADIGWPAFFLLLAGVFFLLFRAPAQSCRRERPAKAILIVLCLSAAVNIVWHLPVFVYLTVLCGVMLSGPTSGKLPMAKKVSLLSWIGMLGMMLAITLSLGWYGLREYWGAREQWSRILRCNPRDAEAWQQWADRQPQFDNRLAGLNRAVALVPENAYFREDRAQTLEASHLSGNYPLAMNDYLKALEYAPKRPQNALDIGRILFLSRHPAEALSWFKRALAMEPYYWEADLWIARCLAMEGRRDQAVKILRNLQRRRQDYLDRYNRIADEFGVPLQPAGYGQSILSYDDNVVRQEIHKLLTGKQVY